ncbi:MAG TPA: hypothetical protein VLW52_11620 [Opitutaceae bacterium]|nr:hypothetical protein [Opitutaceae bacterium]
MNSRERWSRILVIVGSIAVLVGAIDPMEGSLIILPGSGLVALGALVGQYERRLIAYRVWVFVLIAFGVGALFGLSRVGGFGGTSGHSMWWGALILPYLIGWSMGIWGPGIPRWVPAVGIVVSVWYLAMPVMVLVQSRSNPSRPVFPVALIVVATTGLLTIGGCTLRLRRRAAERHQEASAA